MCFKDTFSWIRFMKTLIMCALQYVADKYVHNKKSERGNLWDLLIIGGKLWEKSTFNVPQKQGDQRRRPPAGRLYRLNHSGCERPPAGRLSGLFWSLSIVSIGGTLWKKIQKKKFQNFFKNLIFWNGQVWMMCLFECFVNFTKIRIFLKFRFFRFFFRFW